MLIDPIVYIQRMLPLNNKFFNQELCKYSFENIVSSVLIWVTPQIRSDYGKITPQCLLLSFLPTEKIRAYQQEARHLLSNEHAPHREGEMSVVFSNREDRMICVYVFMCVKEIERGGGCLGGCGVLPELQCCQSQ